MPLFGKKKAPKTLGDTNLTQAPQALGNTTANQVYKTTYKDRQGFEGKGVQDGYFKEDAEATVAKYAVGASSIAKGMKLGSLIPETKFATHDLTAPDGTHRTGVSGAVSKGATGEALSTPVFDTDIHDSFMASEAGKSQDHVEGVAFMRGYKEVNGRYMDMSGSEINDIDLSNPTTQKGLNDLQWFDALIGNSDRHGGNILVDRQSGQVSGIDNDLSFGAGALAKAGGKVDENFVLGNDAKMLGFPSLIDKDMSKKLLKLNNDKLKKMLIPKGIPDEQKMDDRELKQVYDRLEVIKTTVKEMKKSGQVITKWDDKTYQDQIDEDHTARATSWNKSPVGGSYLQRQHLYMQEAKDSSKDTMWRPGHRQTDAPGSLAQPQPPVQQAPPQPAPPQPAPPQPTPPQVPSRVGRPQLSNSNEGTTNRSLSSRVLDTPWAQDFKRAKPKSRV